MSTFKLIKNKILVLGRRGAGKLSIVKQILSITNQSIDDFNIEDKNHSGIKIPWKINTKYYSAKVDFWIDETVHKDHVNKEVIQGYENEENGIGKVVDAILFIFKKDEPATFDDIKVFTSFIQQYDPAITLAIGTGKIIQGVDDPYEDWCLENGFEYVDMEVTKKDNIDERIGIERILEALQSNMWEGLTRITQTAGKSSNIENDEYHHELIEALSQANLKANESTSSQLHDHNSAPFDDNDAEFFGDALPSQLEIENMHRQIFCDFDDEDGLDKVLTRLSNLREKSKSLSDEERRKLAASVACSFGMHMGD
ncbi:alpha and gamma adaptin binding protein p34-domain-containing protein [Glomus cerebriforme]|uniref:Alpha and gamma adaptin binding protein p34-domain-containing protein n=1 Tax=Glomus cerebriforme TaxID=658196 RepID=A0A397T7K9_9GLOM|nr:alpha and gamma adaptin binding protein p34-domain-containing protein [Glomus cerebriforme]